MPESRQIIDVEPTGPDYLGWRSELLARLALARVPGLTVTDLDGEHGWDFLVVNSQGFCFFVLVKGFSSLQSDLTDVAAADELRWPLSSQEVHRARASQIPVLLFLFDADTDHGRYLRLDTLPEEDESGEQTVRLPRGNVLNKENLGQYLVELQVSSRK